MFDGPAHGHDLATAVAVDSAGLRVFVTGASLGASSDFDAATIAFDGTTGTRRWAARYNGPGNVYNDGWVMGVDPLGRSVFVAGASVGLGGFVTENPVTVRSNLDFATIAYDAASGNR